MTATDIAIIIAAGANAAGVLIGVGALNQKLTDVRDDMRALRSDVQNALQTLLLTHKPGNPGEPH